MLSYYRNQRYEKIVSTPTFSSFMIKVLTQLLLLEDTAALSSGDTFYNLNKNGSTMRSIPVKINRYMF